MCTFGGGMLAVPRTADFLVTAVNQADVMWSFCLSFVLSFCKHDTDECGNGRRPNLSGTGKGWPSGSGWLLVVIRICAWILDHFFSFFHHFGIGDFWSFVSISHTINGRFVPYLAKWLTPRRRCIHNMLEQIRQTSGSGSIRKSVFESRITFAWNFGVGGGLRSVSALVVIIR